MLNKPGLIYLIISGRHCTSRIVSSTLVCLILNLKKKKEVKKAAFKIFLLKHVKEILALLPIAPREQEKQGCCVLLCVHVLCRQGFHRAGRHTNSQINIFSFKITYSQLSRV